MAASTVLEIVRMGSSAIGAVFAFLALVESFREVKRVHGRETTTGEEMFQREADIVGSNGTRMRLLVFLAIQAGMFIVAKQAYDVVDNPEMPISALALSSNLNQIFVTMAVTGLTLWDFRDLSSRTKIERMAAFIPLKRTASRSSRRRETVELEE